MLTKFLANFDKIEIAELCEGVHCVDLGESFQTHIYLQMLASIQPRTSPVKFARAAVRPIEERDGCHREWFTEKELRSPKPSRPVVAIFRARRMRSNLSSISFALFAAIFK